MNSTIKEMADCLLAGDDVFHPSNQWLSLNTLNLGQLEEGGIDNIKRTAARNYFTFMIGFHNDQFRNMVFKTSWSDWAQVLSRPFMTDADVGMSRLRFIQLCVFTRMVWLFALRMDRLGLLRKIPEPIFGNPYPIYLDGQLISQDLSNSVIELYSILDHVPLTTNAAFNICEVGAGYGRNAYVFLRAFPRARYFVVDIPPALYVSQEYLSRVLPDKKIFKFRCFDDIDAVAQEINNADVVFLLPHQMKQLPAKSVDLFINISSFHEMGADQISAYFDLVDHLTAGHLYIKQWHRVTNRLNNITLTESSYPYSKEWKRLMSRTAAIQPGFFEALYAI